MRLFAIAMAMACAAHGQPVAAKDSLGIFDGWAAFRDPGVPRCYAIAKAEPDLRRRDYEPYATVGTWPERQVRGQLHFRLSRELASRPRLSLRVGNRSFALTGGGGDAWARDAATDAAILAAIRSADTLQVYGTDARGNRFSDRYRLAGAATAIDAATLACARIGR